MQWLDPDILINDFIRIWQTEDSVLDQSSVRIRKAWAKTKKINTHRRTGLDERERRPDMGRRTNLRPPNQH